MSDSLRFYPPVHQCDDTISTPTVNEQVWKYISYIMRGRISPQVSQCLWVKSLPGPPHWTATAVAAAAASVLQHGGPEGGVDRGDAAGSLVLVELLLLLENLRRSHGGLGAGEEAHRVPPAVRVALAEGAVTEARLQLLPQEADGHLQDVGLLQLGVGLLLVELLLQDDLELVDATVDAIPAHFFHNRFSQLVKEKKNHY